MEYEGWTDGTEQCRFETAEKPVLKKLLKTAEVLVPLGKSIRVWSGFGPLFGHFFDKNVNFFDVVVTW